MKVIIHQPIKSHVSDDIIREFEKVILIDPQVQIISPSNINISKFAFYQWRLFNRCGIKTNPIYLLNCKSRKNHYKEQWYFTILMGIDFLKCLPHFMLPVRKGLYMFDAWPSSHDLIHQFVKHFQVDHAFLSSSQATERMRKKVCKTQFHWIPEGINPDEYNYYSYQRKDIDVMAFGRKHDTFHEKIKGPLEQDQKVYFYAMTKGKLVFPIFPTKEKFIDGLARSKISICFPSSVTNPKRAGDIQTMTIRYLQSMVSKCLVVGHAPDEMIDLFGYNPVVEADMNDPGSQLREILNKFPEYTSLIERNYNKVTRDFTWEDRWKTITNILQS